MLHLQCILFYSLFKVDKQLGSQIMSESRLELNLILSSSEVKLPGSDKGTLKKKIS